MAHTDGGSSIAQFLNGLMPECFAALEEWYDVQIQMAHRPGTPSEELTGKSMNGTKLSCAQRGVLMPKKLPYSLFFVPYFLFVNLSISVLRTASTSTSASTSTTAHQILSH
jgi:hypothetical protein